MSYTNDLAEVWAVPGQNSIIDTINPSTGLTSVNARTPEDVQAKEPGAVRMTWEDWRKAAVVRQQTPIRWSEVTERKYQEMLEVLPPAFWESGAFLVGEPWDHCFETGRPRFAAYVSRRGRFFTASRPLTVAEMRQIVGTR